MPNMPTETRIDNDFRDEDELSSDGGERFPSEIDLDDGNIDVLQPVTPKT